MQIMHIHHRRFLEKEKMKSLAVRIRPGATNVGCISLTRGTFEGVPGGLRVRVRTSCRKPKLASVPPLQHANDPTNHPELRSAASLEQWLTADLQGGRACYN